MSRCVFPLPVCQILSVAVMGIIGFYGYAGTVSSVVPSFGVLGFSSELGNTESAGFMLFLFLTELVISGDLYLCIAEITV